MRKTLIYTTIFLFLASLGILVTFKEEQMRYQRVRKAYQDKWLIAEENIKSNNLRTDKLNIYLRAFKKERKIELWGKNFEDKQFKLLETFPVCQISGALGPKRKQGDLQIPEGFYHINIFNPYSNFYLSLGLNYPNKSDRILGVRNNLGGDIFIHGNCVTIGCLPITDDLIKELYVYCVEAKNNGQENIPVTVFPSELNDEKFDALLEEYSQDEDRKNLWTDLKKGFDHFNQYKTLPKVTFLNNGRHRVDR